MRFASNNNEMRKKIQDYSYGLTDLIGKGYSSSVFRGINEKTKEQVAIKVIDLRSLKDRPAKQMLEGQIDALKKLNHINILKCHDIYSTVNNCYIITEFCNEGDLENLLKKRQKLPEEQSIPIFRDIVSGFRVIAQSGFLHRDLKPANILMKDKIAKIADFGFAKRVTTNPKQTVNVGSPLYMSPESLKQNIYTVKSDIWSLGIILYQMLHGRAPWQSSSQKQLIQKMNKQVYTINRSLSQDLKDFIRKCLINDEAKRIDLTEFFNHPFILRITQQNGIPQLLRKQTSINQNAQIQPKQFLSHKQIIQNPSSNNYLQQNNSSQQPTSTQQLHHRKPAPNSKHKTEKQFTSQINYMRYIYRLLQAFPSSNTQDNSGSSSSKALKFIAMKQLFMLIQNLKLVLNQKDKENIFNFQAWDQFICSQEKYGYYKQVLADYGARYEKIRKQLDQLMNKVKSDKRLASICDDNFARSQNLSILAIKYSIQQCKAIWQELIKMQSKVTSIADEAGQASFSKVAVRLDLIITFYQLNCLLVDNFYDPDYFARNSKIDVIIENKPAMLTTAVMSQLEHKLKLLQIIK